MYRIERDWFSYHVRFVATLIFLSFFHNKTHYSSTSMCLWGKKPLFRTPKSWFFRFCWRRSTPSWQQYRAYFGFARLIGDAWAGFGCFSIERKILWSPSGTPKTRPSTFLHAPKWRKLWFLPFFVDPFRTSTTLLATVHGSGSCLSGHRTRFRQVRSQLIIWHFESGSDQTRPPRKTAISTHLTV